MIDADFRQALQSRAVEVLRGYVPSLKQQGKQWSGHCPFHDDATPSFVVSPTNGLFYCHGCHVGGDVLTFLQRMHQCSFPEAVTEAARIVRFAPIVSRSVQPQHTALAATATTVATLLAEWLWSDVGQPGRAYLRSRGIAEETAHTFGLGFVPDHPTLIVQGLRDWHIDLACAQQLGLVTQKHERWVGLMRGRLLFPICDRTGQVHGFGARTVTGQGPKYLNSPDSPLFHKRTLWYGLPQTLPAIQQERHALIVEGYCDVLTLYQAGLRHVVAPMASIVTPEQIGVLRPLTERVTLLFDGDEAGHKATRRAMGPLLESALHATVATLPAGADPDTFVRQHGGAALTTLLTTAQPIVAFVIDALLQTGNRTQVIHEVMTFVQQLQTPLARLAFLHEAELALILPAGSLVEAAGAGDQRRRELEGVLCGLLLTVPAVCDQLRGKPLPLSDPALRSLAEHVVQGRRYSGDLLDLARAVVQQLQAKNEPTQEVTNQTRRAS
jgi:DNA primase